MAREVHKFAVTVPITATPAAPQVSNLVMPPREILSLTVIVPPGTRGLVGFAIGAAGVPFIPYQPGAWIVADNEKIEWPLEGQITSGAWQMFAYNTGRYPHTLEIRFLANLAVAAAGGALIPLAQLQPS
jgi:hypothetical protein